MDCGADVIGLICAKLPVSTCLTLSQCNRRLRNIIYGSDRNSLWVFRWKREMSEVNVPEDKRTLIRGLLTSESQSFDQLEDLISQVFHHDTAARRMVNMLDDLFRTGADKAIRRLLDKQVLTLTSLNRLLQRGVNSGYLNLVQLVLEKNSTLVGFCVFGSALETGNIPIIHALAEKGAAKGYSCVPYKLIERGNTEMLDYLYAQGMLRRRYCLGYALLIGSCEMADYFLGQGLTIGLDSVVTIVRKGDLKTLGYCLKHGVDIALVGGTLLRAACESDQVNVVEYLLNRGVNLNSLDQETIQTMRKENYEYLLNFLVASGLDLSE